MKTKTLFIIIFMTMSFFSMAQSAERKTQIQKNERGIIRSVEFSSEDKTVRIPESADEFFRDMLKVQPADRFEKRPHRSRREGFTHEHFQQYYDDIRVEGGGYNFHFRNGEMFFAHGNYVRIDGLNTKPAITSDEAKNSFAQHMEIPLELITDYLSDLIIKEIPFQGNVLPVLVYKITLFANHENNTKIGFVDAQNGKVILKERTFYDYPVLPNLQFGSGEYKHL